MSNPPESDKERKLNWPQLVARFLIFLSVLLAIKGCADILYPPKPATPTPVSTTTSEPSATSTGTASITPSIVPSATTPPRETIAPVIFLTPSITDTITNTPITYTPTLEAEVRLDPITERINVKIVSTNLECSNTSGGVQYAVIKLLPYNGTAPYTYEIYVNYLVSETYPPVAESEPIRLVISGGQTKQIRIKSANSAIWEWTGRIYVPAKDEQCKKTIQPTDTRKPTLTIPTTTSIVSDPTLTPVIPITKTLTPIITPTKTPTPIVPFTKTYTPVIPFTKTYTPIIPPTKTYTPVIPPTKTYTSTPKNPKECQDGKDNDGDNLIDYPADHQCTDLNDNKESH